MQETMSKSKISDHYNKNLLFDLGNGELCNAQEGVLDNFEHGKLGVD